MLERYKNSRTALETYIGSISANTNSGNSNSSKITVHNDGMLVIYADANMLIRQFVSGSACIFHNENELWKNTKTSTSWNIINLFNGWRCFSVKQNDVIEFNVTNGQANESGAGATHTTIQYYMVVFN